MTNIRKRDFPDLRKVITAILAVALCLFFTLSCSPRDRVGRTTAAITGGSNDVNTPNANATVQVYTSLFTAPCTGTLIAPDIVLTAAHCVQHRQPLAATPRMNPTSPDPCNWEQPGKWYPLYFDTAGISVVFGNTLTSSPAPCGLTGTPCVIIASHYSVVGWADIMLLRLQSSVSSDIALPKPALARTSVGDSLSSSYWRSQNFRLAGWGTGAAIRQTANARSGLYFLRPPWRAPLTANRCTTGTATDCGCMPNKMCVTVTGGALPGGGDSGGPLFWTDLSNGQEYVIGAFQRNRGSFGSQYTVTFGPGGPTSDGRVTPRIGAWIEQVLGISTNERWKDQTPIATNESGDLFGFSLVAGRFYISSGSSQNIAVGAPGKNDNTGVVFVYRFSGDDFFSPLILDQSGAGLNEPGDEFGYALASGDFNSDGFADLVVGAPGEDYNSSGPHAGVVFLFSGSTAGPTNPRKVLKTLVDRHERPDRFGTALAVGDFDRDGRDDLAVGSPGETVMGASMSGAVYYYLNGSSNLSGSSDVNQPNIITQTGIDNNEPHDMFGKTLAAGDFNGDGFDDLAVGAPYETISAGGQSGAVYVFYGSSSGLQSPVQLDQQPAGRNEHRDEFGYALAVGDFNTDGIDDLAIGAPGEDYNGSGLNAGVVFIFSGSSGGLINPTVFGQDPSGRNESGDRFGSALSAGDFNGDSITDLAIGAPGENFSGSGPDAGLVYIAYGIACNAVPACPAASAAVPCPGGLSSGLSIPVYFDQSPSAANQRGDKFGSALLAFQSIRFSDGLIIGAPGENVHGSGPNAGVFFYLP